MSQTVWGVAAKVGEIVRHVDDRGRLSSLHTVREYDKELPDEPIRVTAGHDPNLEIGDLVHAEIDPGGRLLCVCVLDDDLDGLVDEGRWYFSPDYVAYGNDLQSRTFTVNRASITGLAITPSPAGLAAKLSPLQTMPGDLRDHADRYSKWPSSWRSNALLERAVDDLPRALELRHSARRIVDRRMSEAQVEAMYYARSAAEHPGSYQRPAGGLRHSAHRGKILSVR